ncbi:DUF4446 family protein [Desulfosporosinus metallidurans]
MLIVLESIMSLTWWAVSVLSLLLLISLLMIFLLQRRMKRFETSHLVLQTFMSGHQLDTLLQECIQKVDEQGLELKKSNARLTPIEDKLRASVDRVELVRFRAFENVGSDLSFAFALLNQEGSGIVISAIHNRDESRVYGKPVKGGESNYSLTAEEREVIAKAMDGQKI